MVASRAKQQCGSPAQQACPLRRVLVVDDSAAQRRGLALMLRNWGYAVEEAASGSEAMAVCHAEPVDMVLSDWLMPGMSGLEFCRAFRSLHRDNYGYFIVLTSSAEKDAVAQGLEEGADDFLLKPVSPEELRARLKAGERILSMERELQEKNRLLGQTLARLQQAQDALERDLAQARHLQQSLVPRHEMDFGCASVSLLLHPSGPVGGDLVGCFPINPSRLGLFALDVAGHGVSSALMMARLAGLFSGAAPDRNIALALGDGGWFEGRAPAEVAAQLNQLLLGELQSDLYCTLVYADLELSNGRVRLVQAGHPHPLVQRASGAVEFLGQGGLPIGLIEDARYSGCEAILTPGDRLFIMSDGMTECTDPRSRQLSETGMAQLVERLAGLRGRAFQGALLGELERHAGSSDFADDVSAVLVEYRGPPQA